MSDSLRLALRRHVARTLTLAALLPACSSEDDEGFTFPIPDEFEAAFVAGQVCMPSQIHTGTTESGGAPTYPIRFDVCRHRCITFDGATRIEQSFLCVGSQCELMILAMAHANRVPEEPNCNAAALVDPPPGECTPQSFAFQLPPPCCLNDSGSSERSYATGDFRVTIPFLNIDQTEQALSRIENGEQPTTVVNDLADPGLNANRQFVVNFDPAHAEVTSLSASDCHVIPPPSQ